MSMQNSYLITCMAMIMHTIIIVAPVHSDPTKISKVPLFEGILEKSSDQKALAYKYEDNKHSWQSTAESYKNIVASKKSFPTTQKKDKGKEKEKPKCDKLGGSQLLKNLCKWMTHCFTEPYQPEKEWVKAHLHVRKVGNETLSIPLLEGPRLLSSRTRPFYLSWQGGKPPYRSRLYHQYERNPFIDQETVENNLKVDNLTLSPGDYIIKINDAESRKLQTKFTVVDSNQLPHIPDEDLLRQSDLCEATKITLYAAWLSDQNDGKWIFESYQQASGIAENYYPASLLCNALAEGRRPLLEQSLNNNSSTSME